MLHILKKYPDLLAFGVLTAAFSAPGQSFLVSFFIPHMQEHFQVSRTYLMSLYGLATTISALILPWMGRLYDRVELTRFSLGVSFLLALGCFILGMSNSLIWVVVGFILIRNLGQGTLCMISSTSMAKFFGKMRGKALGIGNAGYPLSEALFPSLVTLVIGLWGWRSGWHVLGLLVVMVLIPSILFLLGRGGEKRILEDTQIKDNLLDENHPDWKEEIHWTLQQVLKDAKFYVFIAPILLTPAFLTALFLNQDQLILWKGWTESLIAQAFIAFAILRAIVAFLIGPVVDRYHAGRVMPFILIPFLLGLCLLRWGDGAQYAFLYLGFAGLTLGFGRTVSSAFWAELYGTKHLGSIRGVLSSLIVLSTAISPIVFGYLIDSGKSMNSIINGMILSLFVGVLMTAWGIWKFYKRPADLRM